MNPIPTPAQSGQETPRKMAPVQGYSAGIPWEMHLRAYDVYCKRYSPQQALIEGWCRGGFATSELDMFIPGWREELSVVAKLERELNAANAKLAEKPAHMCRMDHTEIWHNDSESEHCPLCLVSYQLHALQSAARKVVKAQHSYEKAAIHSMEEGVSRQERFEAINQLAAILPPATQPNDTAGEKLQ